MAFISCAGFLKLTLVLELILGRKREGILLYFRNSDVSDNRDQKAAQSKK